MINRILIILVVLAATTTDVFSQFILYRRDSVSMPEYKLDDVTVRAFRETHKARELPAAITMVGRVSLERNQTGSLKDLTAVVPNFYMPEYGSKLTSPVYIRGVGSRINSPSVGLYVDNAPYFEKSSFDFDFFEIERVEVLRGPQGTLYGRNTMGGLINIFTRSPFREQGTRLTLSGGSYGVLKANATQYIKAGRRAAFSLSAGINHRDGFFRNEFSGKSADNLLSAASRLRAEVYITESLKAEYVVSYEHSRQGGYPYMVYHDTLTSPSVNYDSYSYYNRNMLANSLLLRYELPGVIISSTSSYHYFDDYQAIDQDFTPSSLFFVTQEQMQHSLSQEIIVKPYFDNRYSWVAGAFLFRQLMDKDVILKYGEDGIVRYRLPGPTSTLKRYDNPTSGAALFHQSTLRDIIAEGLSVTAGIRIDYEGSDLGYDYFRTISGTGSLLSEFESDLRFFEVMPRLAIVYSLNESNNLYATVSKGYKTGGFNSTFEREEDRSFMPEVSWNYEAGVKAMLLSNRLYGDFSLFYIDWRNQQIYQTVPSGQGSMLKNAGRSVSKGLELSFTALLPFESELSVSYGLTDARFTSHVVNESVDYTGNYIPYVPRSTLFAALHKPFTFQSSFIETVSLNLNYNGTGKIYWSESNANSQDYYSVLGGLISLSRKNVTMELWGKNLTNTTFHAFRFDALGNSYVQQGRPLWVGFNLKITI